MFNSQMYRRAARTMPNFYRSNVPMSNDLIAKYAPSVLAPHAHESRSERYTYIPTIDIIEGLRKNGFQPYEVKQSNTRVPGMRDFTKHMVRLRHEGQAGVERFVGQEFNELILINAHNGGSAYQMCAGVFRLVCLNGMVAGDVVEQVSVRHTGDVMDNVIEGAYRVLEQFEKVDAAKDQMKAITLQPAEAMAYADAAIELRYGEERPVKPADALRVRRHGDEGRDLWTTFNRVQETLIRGGDRFRDANGRRARTREVSGIDQNVKLNKAIWKLTEEMAKLKQAA